MTPLYIEGTQYTPKIEFLANGQLTISGKSLPEDTAKFYEPILDWMRNCTIPTINITIRLHYMNSSSANQMSKLFMNAKQNISISKCVVEWYYDLEDEDALDFGKELEYQTDFEFNFYQYSERLSFAG